MKIVHVIPGLTHERGGPTVVVQALVRHQRRPGTRSRCSPRTRAQGTANNRLAWAKAHPWSSPHGVIGLYACPVRTAHG